MRYALKVYYDGRNFYGSQLQPSQRTVAGELLNAFKKLGVEIEGFQSACRTDRGVSALGNVFALTTEFKLKPRILNRFLPADIRVTSVKEVEANFNPRYEAIEKIYKYFLVDEGYEVKKMEQAARLFEGEHSFHNFCILDRDPVRRINKIKIKKGEVIVITFAGKSFLWQMIRRLVTALKMAGKGEISIDELKGYLDVNCDKKVTPAEPGPLVLWKIKYPFEFENEEYSCKKFVEEIFARQKRFKVRVAIDEEILREVKA